MIEILNKIGLNIGKLGTIVSLNMTLILTNNECFLVPKGEDELSVDKIEIFFPSLELLLDKVVGGWVGSNVNYFDEVKVEGLLDKGTRIQVPLSLSKLSNLILIRDNEEYKII